MKIENGKITCTECRKTGAKLIEYGETTTILQCTKCMRKVKCSTMKVGDALFDVKSMEGKSLI